jgi:hypothetical protein
MRANLRNQVRQTPLPKWKPWLPLLGKDDAPMDAITVTDNGIGMDDENFDSFNTSFSPHRESEGGKGLGRFTWLKAFERVDIDTVFLDPISKEPIRRKFVFDEKYDPDKAPFVPAPGQPTGTKIRLAGFREPYRSETAKSTDYIVQRRHSSCAPTN